MMRPRVFFYVQHLLGIGHLARASRIAMALVADGFDVTVAMGGVPVAGFPGPDIRTVQLPPVITADHGFSGLADIQGNPVDDAFKEKRCRILLEAFDSCRPDIVILEAFPFGRRQMRFELLPLLESISAMSPKPFVVASIRDILQERTKPGRSEETIGLINGYFDLVMVHGDPTFATLDQTFPLAHEIEAKIAYTGLVAAPPPLPASRRFDVLISVGGGAAGKNLVRSAVAAARNTAAEKKWCLISGPNFPKEEIEATLREAPSNLSIFKFREDFASLLTGARLSVSQAGYNTVCDILRAGCRSLLIPFASGGETEQTTRATGLERLRLANVLREDELTSASLAAAIEHTSTGERQIHSLDLEGAHGTARILRELLGVKRSLSA
ncbi:glycosyl transferase [Phyllobacterium phragmitis]|uniref:Glycosyl transferase n=1 Tax=Phyllobacterium phragmitis TaxID=2670329 RepID=A0A2S9IPL5_9HYPH|nr:glycosyltransferase [Phyllobacterium phragmitis]PRD42432.1 glycosyl transferase [Phyllobacterium phragmitis]